MGVRAVPDLQLVSPEVQLPHMRSAQQAHLRWALRSYHDQLNHAQGGQNEAAAADAEAPRQNGRDHEAARHQAYMDARPEACARVAEAFDRHSSNNDVHAFIQELSMHYNKLDASRLPPRPVSGSITWKIDILLVLRQAIYMAHSNRCRYDDAAMQHAMATEVTAKLRKWEAAVKRDYE